MQYYYLLFLVGGIIGMGIIDYRYKLAFWYRRKRTLATIGVALAVFIVWDLAGIYADVFFAGQSPFMLPLRLLPEFPLDELFFLTLLNYCTLVIYRIGAKRWPHTY